MGDRNPMKKEKPCPTGIHPKWCTVSAGSVRDIIEWVKGGVIGLLGLA